MARRGVLAPSLLSLSLFATACDDTPATSLDATVDATRDASVDAPTRTATLRLDDTGAHVIINAGPRGVSLRVERPDGSTWFESPPAESFLEVGTREGGPSDTRAPNTLVRDPAEITWLVPSAITAVDEARRSVTFDLGAAGPLTVTLSRLEDGAWSLDCDASGRDAVMLRWNLRADDGQYHGLGERFGNADAKGTVVPMQFGIEGNSASSTNEHHVPVPFFVSTHSYGVFVESYATGAFDVASTDPARVSATFETPRARVLLFASETPSRVVAAYTRRSGLPRLPPRWVFGPMHWRNEWQSRDELFEDARRIRSEGIATTTIWIDNPWQRSYNDSEFDTTRFPDPPGIFAELARMGFKVLVWSTPYLDAVTDGAAPTNTAERLYLEARDRGYLVGMRGSTTPYVSPTTPGSAGGMPDSNGALVDFSSRPAMDFWTTRLEALVDLGVRGFKLDYGEDVVTDILGARPGFRFSNGEDERTMHSVYPQLYHQAYQNALTRRAGGDGFVLARASGYGGQRYADVIWPGDLDNDFRRAEVVNGRRQVGGLPASVHGLVSLAASGFPNFGADTGGYRGGRPTREVLLRWAEQTALSPVLQLGGGGSNHNPWSYDADATAIYRSLARLHNDLIPYLYANAARASRDGTPAVTALALAFPEDSGARSDGDAYMLGDDLYVAPVLTAGATQRRVHVPSGTWVHWFTRESYTGPSDVTIDAPIGRPVLLVRQGAIIPMLADDVATLTTTSASDVIDLDDRRAVLRARIVPAGMTAFTLADETRIAIDESAAQLRLTFTPGRESSDLRAELDLAHRGATSASAPTMVTRDAMALTRATSAEAVATCDGGCWHYDAATRALRVRIVGAGVVEVR